MLARLPFSIALARDRRYRNLALAKMSEFGRRGGVASAAEPDTTPPEIRYRTSIQHSLLFITSRLLGEVYYLLYADKYEMPSKVTIDPEELSLGRIRADSVAPLHSPASIKRCISRVERTQHLPTPIFLRTYHAILHRCWFVSPPPLYHNCKEKGSLYFLNLGVGIVEGKQASLSHSVQFPNQTMGFWHGRNSYRVPPNLYNSSSIMV